MPGLGSLVWDPWFGVPGFGSLGQGVLNMGFDKATKGANCSQGCRGWCGGIEVDFTSVDFDLG